VGTLGSLWIAYLGGPFWPVDPEVQTPPPSTSYPFDVPFQISNKSGLFPFDNLSVKCALLNVHAGNRYIQKSLFSMSGGASNLLPNHSDWYICPSHLILSQSDTVEFATIFLIMEYNTYWPIVHRTMRSVTYTLDAQSTPPRWLEGDRIY
jgi:hypothetical protein